MPDEVKVVGVIGAGTMGAQIAQQCALCGMSVLLMDAEQSQLDRARAENTGHLQRRVDRGKLSAADMRLALERVRPTTDLAQVANEAEFVIEAVVERLEVKREVFALLDRLAPRTTVLATNSSTIGISQIAEGLMFRERMVNMHFFHPVLVMRLVEVMRGPETSDETVARTLALARQMDREPVVIEREIYGLLVNRILGAIKREAFSLAEQGYATPEDIDRAVKLGLNHPMGPFELTDFSGIDVFYYAAMQRYRETGDEADKPSRLLAEKVEQGELGRKTGKGFYTYPRPDGQSRT